MAVDVLMKALLHITKLSIFKYIYVCIHNIVLEFQVKFIDFNIVFTTVVRVSHISIFYLIFPTPKVLCDEFPNRILKNKLIQDI